VVQRYVQAAVEPDDVRTLFASDTQAAICIVQVLGGSQVSPVSSRPLPQPGQSTSVVGPHATAVGQNVSAGPQVRCCRVQTKLQLDVLPEVRTTVLASFRHMA
jgi:hypothetical protein